MSILFAFGIDASWEARRERATERVALEALLSEMTDNRQYLIGNIAINDSAGVQVGEWMRSRPEEVAEMSADSTSDLHTHLWAPYTYDPDVGALSTFLSRDGASSELVLELRRAVTNLDALLADSDEESTVLWQSSREVLGLLTAHIADLIPEEGGRPRLSLILQDYGPRLARARADDRLVAAVIAKFNLQRIYTNELRGVLWQTERVIELLEDVLS